ncbi:fla cluster protein FlaG [Natronomonas pharaonis DSM 2160]|uniref:Fla cluster protein FlaG n=1 Tax=Natronomonas pharaonis (strain ATCC 35678 / DSM 2160 / CIP 103997 / JCM 8858 / NBRC 14720 / NCIMB 2260 / Gabara) TaxID=348780 RepID=A0A1U7EVQ5_NATPD|nr:flagellin [Natronomonas pharaonis]CAI49139.1 fla cluster protein FlaG [Natronomonas pharaonis DSM 2160]
MSGISASTLIIFIASILVAAGVAGTLVTTVGDISTSAESQGDAISESINTDIEILNDGRGSSFYQEDVENNDGETVDALITLYARNAGSTSLHQDPDRINVLVNGQLITSENLNLESPNGGDDEVWAEDEVLEFEITLDEELDGSGNRVSISVDGSERAIEFPAEA